MAYKIELKSTVIPFTIGGLNFDINASDDKLMEFGKFYGNLITNAANVSLSLENDENDYCFLVQQSMDCLLGDGSFDKLYELTPSVIILFDALNQIVDALMSNLVSRVRSPRVNGKKSKLSKVKR